MGLAAIVYSSTVHEAGDADQRTRCDERCKFVALTSLLIPRSFRQRGLTPLLLAEARQNSRIAPL